MCNKFSKKVIDKAVSYRYNSYGGNTALYVTDKGVNIMARYGCMECGWIYDEEFGDDELGIEAGTLFEELGEDFTCPMCGCGADEFEIVE